MEEQYLVKKPDRPIDWEIEAPGSKSMTNRALLMAALTEGSVELEGVLFSEDSRCFLSALKSLGVELEMDEKSKTVSVTGCNGNIPRKEGEVYVGSAGTAARFLTAMLGLSDGSYTIQSSEQMKKRPMKPLFDLLSGLGAEITYLEREGFLPVHIRGLQKGGGKESSKALSLELDISQSTQFLSALLLISPMIKQGLEIHITSEKTDGSYVRITRSMLEEAGVTVAFDGRNYRVPAGASYRKFHYRIEPDVSAACYFYAAAAITGGSALVRKVHSGNRQGDMKFLSVLRDMGCTVEEEDAGIRVTGPAIGSLRGIEVNMNDFSDQALTLAAIAPYANSRVRITGIGHIRLQESDRLCAMAAELGKTGICCAEEQSAITIFPGQPRAAVIETYEDHRVAMAFSLMGLRTEGIVIKHPDCCKKTFEEYFTILDRLTNR